VRRAGAIPWRRPRYPGGFYDSHCPRCHTDGLGWLRDALPARIGPPGRTGPAGRGAPLRRRARPDAARAQVALTSGEAHLPRLLAPAYLRRLGALARPARRPPRRALRPPRAGRPERLNSLPQLSALEGALFLSPKAQRQAKIRILPAPAAGTSRPPKGRQALGTRERSTAASQEAARETRRKGSSWRSSARRRQSCGLALVVTPRGDDEEPDQGEGKRDSRDHSHGRDPRCPGPGAHD
jgi:hypothetical protein